MFSSLFYSITVKDPRKKKGLSSLQLAINADINKNYLNDLENGRRNPSLMILRKVAIALDIDLSELFIGIRDYSLSNDYNKIK